METTITRPVSEWSAIWAYVSAVSIGAVLLLIILLHFLKSDLNPTWHMVSEYAIGRHGWMMQAAFGFLACSCASLALAAWQQVISTGGRIGLVLLVIAAIGLTIAAFNNTDPVNTAKKDMSLQGKMHGLGFLIGVPSLTVAVLLISTSLRANAGWLWARQPLFWSAHVPWISIIAMMAVIFILLPKYGGRFGPGVVIGLPNRLWMLGCCIWIFTVAYGIIQLKNSAGNNRQKQRSSDKNHIIR